MIASTDRLSRTVSRLGQANRRIVSQDGHRVPARLHASFERLRDLDILSGSIAHRGSLLDSNAPARA